MNCTKKFIAVIMIMIMVSSPVVTYAQSAGASVIISGSASTGGLAGGYTSNTERNAIALTMILLQGLGVSVHLGQTAINAGLTAYEYVKGLFAKWVGGTSAENLNESQREELKKRFTVIEGGGGNTPNEVGPDGTIFFGAGATVLLQAFYKWAKDNGYMGDLPSASDSINGTKSVSELELVNYVGNNWKIEFYLDANLNNPISLPVFFIKTETYCIPVAYTKLSSIYESVRYVQRKNSNNITSNQLWQYTFDSNTGESYYYRILGWNNPNDSVSLENIPNGFYVETQHLQNDSGINGYAKKYFTDLNGAWDYQEGTSDLNMLVGDYDAADFSSNIDNPYTTVTPELIEQLKDSIEDNSKVQIKISDYINALLQQMNKAANPQYVPIPETVPAINLPTFEPINIPLPDPEVGTWPTVTPSEQPENDPVTPPGDAEPVNDPEPAPPEVSVPQMMLPLDEYFPFCVPFDIYALFQKLQGTPIAPSYTFEFTEPFSGAHVVMPVDLSIFNDAMVVVRKVEVVLYIVCLAVASRKFYAR